MSIHWRNAHSHIIPQRSPGSRERAGKWCLSSGRSRLEIVQISVPCLSIVNVSLVLPNAEDNGDGDGEKGKRVSRKIGREGPDTAM